MKCSKIFITSLFFLSIMFPFTGYSAYIGSGNPRDAGNNGFQLVPCSGVDCDFNALMELANRIISFILYISIPLAAISFSYAGYLYLSAAGDPSKIESAHKIFGNVLKGFIFVLSGWLIVYTITSALLGNDFKNSTSNLLRNGGVQSGSGGVNIGGGGSDTGSGTVGNVGGGSSIDSGINNNGNTSGVVNKDLQVIDKNLNPTNPNLYTPPTDYNIEKNGF